MTVSVFRPKNRTNRSAGFQIVLSTHDNHRATPIERRAKPSKGGRKGNFGGASLPVRNDLTSRFPRFLGTRTYPHLRAQFCIIGALCLHPASPIPRPERGQSRITTYYVCFSLRSKLAREPAVPMFNLSAIHCNVIAVSRRNWRAIFTLRLSPLLRLASCS
jgi:hypothetical protein